MTQGKARDIGQKSEKRFQVKPQHNMRREGIAAIVVDMSRTVLRLRGRELVVVCECADADMAEVIATTLNEKFSWPGDTHILVGRV